MARGESRDWGNRGVQDARLRDAPVPRVISLQGCTGGIHDGASAGRDQALEGGGEGRVPDGIGQIDHLCLEDRSQSPVPPAVVGDEPHVGSRSIRPSWADFRSFGSAVSPAASRRPAGGQRRHGRVSGRSASMSACAGGGAGCALREGERLPMAEKFRITYATMSADNEELQAAYDAAAERARAELGKAYPVDRERRGALARRDLRGALADRQRHHDRQVLPGHDAGRRRRRGGRQGVPARVGPDGLAGARAHPAQRRRHHGGARLRPGAP